MTAFFIPGMSAEGDDLENAYRAIRHEAEAETGQHVTAQRIFKLAYRRKGRDEEATVGDREPAGDSTVVAILALCAGTAVGAGAYTIRCATPDTRCEAASVTLDRHHVYAVTEFSA